MRRSRRRAPRRLPACPPSPTIPGWSSTRWEAHRASTPRAGPGQTRIFSPPCAEFDELLRERGAKTPEKRRAHFVCALCVAWPDGHQEEFEGRVSGQIVFPPRGGKGFGYDPIFLPDGYDRTFGEMTGEEKHGLPPLGRGLSHRARAFLKLAEACLERR